MFRTMMIFSVASISAALPVFAQDKPVDSPKTLERKMHGSWKGYGPCDGRLVLNSDGTYERTGVGPGGESNSGALSLNWDALPLTLVFDCKTADDEELEGTAIRTKLVRLDDSGLEILFAGQSEPIVFNRSEK